MKPLQKIYQRFVILVICRSHKKINFAIKLCHISISIICLISLTINLIASFVFFKKFVSTELASAICAIFQICGLSIAIYTLITAYIKHHDIKKIFDAFQEFYDESKWKT